MTRSDTYPPCTEIYRPVRVPLADSPVVRRQPARPAGAWPIERRIEAATWEPKVIPGGRSVPVVGLPHPGVRDRHGAVIRGGPSMAVVGAEAGSVESQRAPTILPFGAIRAMFRTALVAVVVAGLMVVLTVPRAGADRGPGPTVTHVVQAGDTLWSVADDHTPDTGDVRATVALIRSANPSSSGFLAVGDVIEVPVDPPGGSSGR